MKVPSFVLLTAALAAASVLHAADIIGTVTLTGTPPAEIPI
jgi:hypothetical protein